MKYEVAINTLKNTLTEDGISEAHIKGYLTPAQLKKAVEAKVLTSKSFDVIWWNGKRSVEVRYYLAK